MVCRKLGLRKDEMVLGIVCFCSTLGVVAGIKALIARFKRQLA